MIENIGDILQLGLTAVALVSSVLFFWRAKKAEIVSKELQVKLTEIEVKLKETEVKSSEISTADEMIELVKKAHAEALALKEEFLRITKEQADESKKELGKLQRYIGRLEKALKAINTCPYLSECPVPDVMQSCPETDDHDRKHKAGQREDSRDDPRHDRGS